MPYTNITALVPAGEHFDESAVNEGVYLTVGHVNAIENSLGTASTAAADHKKAIDDLNKKLQDQALQAQQAVDAQKEAEKKLADANKTIQDKDAKIVELEKEVKELEATDPELPGTKKNEDKTGAKGKVAFHDDPNASFNKMADELFGAPVEKKD